MNTEAINTILGMKVRQARLSRGLTLSEFAELCALSPSYITEIEKGRKYPKPDKIMRMAEVLGTTYDNLVSVKLDPSQAYLESVLSSSLLRNFPFELFGLEASDLVDLITRAPAKASALIHTLVEIARQYDMKSEHFLRAALRSYQEIHENYFDEIEEAVDRFIAEHDLAGEFPLSLDRVAGLVRSELGYEIDESLIPQYPHLTRYRSIYVAGDQPVLLVNPALSPAQKKFVLARELGYQFLDLKERAITSAPDTVRSFEQVLNDFLASYFAGALLMPREIIVRDLRELFSLPTWQPKPFLALIDRYDVTPEMLLYRFSELIPEYFDIKLHFLRFHDYGDDYQLTKQFNMSRLMIPSGLGLNEHHCRRWLTIGLLKRLAAARADGGPIPVVGAQRSEFLNSGDTFLCIGYARPLTLSPNVGSSVTIGFKYDTDLPKTIRFALDPNIPHVIINETCERCPLTVEQCSARAVPPTVLEQQAQDEERQKQLEEVIAQAQAVIRQAA
ncbi:MAG: XRE family transcriptional regulator [Chloroflexi bacterium]|nr:MAG: XRE family transcriptional regulator [Chloroflexota bacterium]